MNKIELQSTTGLKDSKENLKKNLDDKERDKKTIFAWQER